MKREINRKSQHKVVHLDTASEQVAEHVRLMYKQMAWAVAHMRAIYDIIKPVDAPELIDPNQLKLFDEETRTNN